MEHFRESISQFGVKRIALPTRPTGSENLVKWREPCLTEPAATLSQTFKTHSIPCTALFALPELCHPEAFCSSRGHELNSKSNKQKLLFILSQAFFLSFLSLSSSLPFLFSTLFLSLFLSFSFLSFKIWRHKYTLICHNIRTFPRFNFRSCAP